MKKNYFFLLLISISLINANQEIADLHIPPQENEAEQNFREILLHHAHILALLERAIEDERIAHDNNIVFRDARSQENAERASLEIENLRADLQAVDDFARNNPFQP